MFTQLVSAIRHLLDEHGEYSMNLRRDESPPSAVFHCLLDGYEYVISIQPTKAATQDPAEDGEP